MTASILITGGTGTIGSEVVPRLLDRGQSVRTLSRRFRPDRTGVEHVIGDTVAGSGLSDAVRGVGTVLHLAGGARGDDVAAGNIARVAREAGTGHLVLISVIGADRMPIGYFRAKATAEQEIATSGVPWSVIRVAQVHDFVLPVARLLCRLPIVPVPTGLRFEPVEVAVVAAALTRLTLGDPVGRAPDLAGPEVLGMRQIVQQYLQVHGRRRALAGVRIPGAVGRAYRAGDNLAVEGAVRDGIAWRDYLQGHRSRKSNHPSPGR
jgi:uncharacterized protein YbjT (DUF2867 family)